MSFLVFLLALVSVPTRKTIENIYGSLIRFKCFSQTNLVKTQASGYFSRYLMAGSTLWREVLGGEYKMSKNICSYSTTKKANGRDLLLQKYKLTIFLNIMIQFQYNITFVYKIHRKIICKFYSAYCDSISLEQFRKAYFRSILWKNSFRVIPAYEEIVSGVSNPVWAD